MPLTTTAPFETKIPQEQSFALLAFTPVGAGLAVGVVYTASANVVDTTTTDTKSNNECPRGTTKTISSPGSTPYRIAAGRHSRITTDRKDFIGWTNAIIVSILDMAQIGTNNITTENILMGKGCQQQTSRTNIQNTLSTRFVLGS